MEQPKQESLEAQKKESTQSLYPERVFGSYAEVIDEIKRLESGELAKQELNEVEKFELLEFEKQFALRLEGLFQLKGLSFDYHPSYFETEEGRRDLLVIFENEDASSLSKEEIEKLFLERPEVLAGLSTAERERIQKSSTDFSDGAVKEEIFKRFNEENEFTTEGIKVPEKKSVTINPDEVLTKLAGLRELKKEIKEIVATLAAKEDNYSQAQKVILEMYSKRINELIAQQYIFALKIQEKLTVLGAESLSGAEQDVLTLVTVTEKSNADRVRARMDKFRYGATAEYNDDGYKEQVSEKLLEYAKEIEIESAFLEENKNAFIEARGLDPKKIDEKIITAEKRKEWGERILAAYGLLSSDESVDVEKRTLDYKWRFIQEEKRKTMSVDRNRKVIKDRDGETTPVHAFSVALAHEIEGHVLQSANRENIPLNLFELDVAGDRASVYSEGGAMYNQNYISKELFGYEQLPKPHYVRAMARRLSGGSFADCLQAYYESAIISSRNKYKEGSLSKEEFDKKARAVLKTSLSSSRRLFRDGGSLDSTSNMLLSSKDTAYLEQRKLVEGLKEAGLLKLAYVGGLNLENAKELIRFGLLDLDKIQEPKFETIKIWEEVRDTYTETGV
ncbi:MAG: hypothetical protein WDZ74_02390 [Candidatus Paceibacterota bacterium]